MDVVILAAGAGTRMRPLTDRTPKPLLTVGDRPLAAHVADVAVESGASSIVFVVGPDADRVRATFGDRYLGVPVTYAVQDPPEGTAGAVRTALPHVDGQFAVLNGDNIYDQESIARLFSTGPSIGVHEVDDPSSYGVVDVDGGRCVGIVEKPANPPSTLANAGAYVFPAVEDDWFDVDRSDRGEFELTDVITRLVAQTDVTAVEMERWMDVGRPWELLEANETLVPTYPGSVEGDVHPSAVLSTESVVERGATILPGTVIEGAVYVREGATVGPHARVRGTTLVGEDATIGHAVEVKNSVLAPNSTVAHLSYVGDSVLGPDVNLGAGTNIANLRHDDQAVEVTVRGERVSTGRRKFGAVVGPGVKTGINTSIDPGVTLSTEARTLPGEVIHRDR
ncbi:bifunctional sugar-1-phosphate nucleotidylyltransferase/acetyltransferase [Halanaeroarchaeum sp. HSR-CO]|uniref:bifunctional sugar-1-phosphate nucleotidylyltransferase/acetyltransferase n=1 Tax=Halanaeroarchaeum sp. HSR-CO TaxID=2866382 RepID=UPI00217E091F|nr:bifunctional sugar-1-phosphate nucleotidylyltransferase/acetyltransferase [Halanaeroarchaeum sp. HSR-CO]